MKKTCPTCGRAKAYQVCGCGSPRTDYGVLIEDGDSCEFLGCGDQARGVCSVCSRLLCREHLKVSEFVNYCTEHLKRNKSVIKTARNSEAFS